MRANIAVVTTMAALLAGCAQQSRPPAADAPLPQARPAARSAAKAEVASAGWRSEPVIYNGRRYAVAFRPANASERLVKISAPGRKLGATKGDGRIVAEIATTAVHHFTCRDSHKARIKPGTLRPRNGAWTLTIVCR